jgi:tetratricopeptide (TPR) repeat protein
LAKIKNNQGGLISFAQFLSTSRNRNVAEAFVGNPSDDSTLEAILFYIQIDFTVIQFPSAAIGNFSHMGLDEEEFLFTMGSIFRIEKIEQDENKLWNIHLSYRGDNDLQLAKLTEQIGRTISDKNPICQLAKLMCIMGKWDKSEQFYARALDVETDWEQKIVIYINLGATLRQSGNLEQALQCYDQAREAAQNYLRNEYNPFLSAIYNNSGLIYWKQKRFDLAIENVHRALQIEKAALKQNQEFIATAYNNIGLIYIDEHSYEQSFQNFRNALDILLQVLPSETNCQIAEIYNNMAICYAHQNNWSKAIEYGERAVNIDVLLLPDDHSDVKRRKNNLEAYRRNKLH